MSDFGTKPRAGNGDVLNLSGTGSREMSFDERPLETLSDWLAAGWVDGASTTSEGSRQAPATRLTLTRIHDLADDTELRARILAWMMEARGFDELSARKVQSLFQIATELRQMAMRLLTVEGGVPQPAPQPSIR